MMPFKAVCNGQGDNGDHCCYIDGQVCEFLDTTTIRCTIWDRMPSRRWEKAPVGRWFAENHPGFTCRDWPQNIPAVFNLPDTNLCCWSN